ncbi:uncharacterized protein LOC119363926 isoform X2 [Triticum dicoccoides]|uniref:uncharacterized protein LOC119363926 isoform X1 n=1 Tax=Triticum dicoccoides TaxID=85692 RepID=UPI00188ECBCF|nr:uncharacterized protein LOC119363926 isoform X1 [Triticum dicoccoides]XP_037485193.1 uncharacterized protein LOC119363926 isoform X2 [Triticum dicoccoides]XP_037485194.1 uncharacterized protein LOC119363926 isoform X2 [Triticum dicoccoides]XP_037485195.1 uncharacterized protein LOC119363926 isoform X2 [Triticum dicoccoides]XP_037485196.1 uncharacterized protein LOC119363926 isoform X2 [Triticum dicoccoides]XP_037485197.1 uncharacterized protein LOC119363926 isoform X2 [Triticum dicoccoides]
MPTIRERRRPKRTAMGRPAGKEQREGFCFFQRAMALEFIIIVSLELRPRRSHSSHFLATSRRRSPSHFKNSERDDVRLPLAAPGRGRGRVSGDAGGGRPEGWSEPAPGLRRRPGGGAGAGPGDGVQAGVQGPVPLRAVRSRHQARRRRVRRDHHFLPPPMREVARPSHGPSTRRGRVGRRRRGVDDQGISRMPAVGRRSRDAAHSLPLFLADDASRKVMRSRLFPSGCTSAPFSNPMLCSPHAPPPLAPPMYFFNFFCAILLNGACTSMDLEVACSFFLVHVLCVAFRRLKIERRCDDTVF